MYTHAKGKGAGKYNGMAKAADWEGKTVKATRQLRNNGGRGVMPGAVGVVESAYSGLNVTFKICSHCGTVTRIKRLNYTDIELAEGQTCADD